MSYRVPPRRADAHLKWLREVGKAAAERSGQGTPGIDKLIPALTGTDYKALEAIDRAWELFAYTRSTDVLYAIALLAREMQPSTRLLARELAARAMDWGDRERYWPEIARAL